ncbi:MAG: hypothetical protein CR986_10150 [Ignavibacteriae bacterium]|nr:MAG: hypothetical protein CR986_10150 [Ignavibacteriota bacterium]
MYKNIILLTFFFLSNLFGKTQDTTALYKWKPGLTLGLKISQLALSNWQAGGENTISWVTENDFSLTYETKNWNFSNNLSLIFGRTKTGIKTFRTTHNKIQLEHQLSYKINWLVNPFIGNSLRTYFTKGYDYKKSEEKSTVNFFDPAYLTQSLGFAYQKFKNFKFRFGVAVQEVFTSKHNSFTDNSLTRTIEKFKLETGIESITSFETYLHKNINYKTKLRLFTRFKRFNIWDIRFDNSFIAKVNSYLKIKLDIFILYEKAQSIKTQFWQALNLGITYKLF